MNVLFQLCVCSPDRGSEYSISWEWLVELRKRLRTDDKIYVVTRTENLQDNIDKYNLKNVNIIPVNPYSHFKKAINWIPFFTYFLWQRRAYREARKVNVKFDIIHLYSQSNFRHPGIWHRFKNSYTIFGPVGGGQNCPLSLLGYDDTFYSIIRQLLGYVCRINPIWNWGINHYSKIYAVNKETQLFLRNSEILLDVCLNRRFQNLEIRKRKHDKPVLIFCGRLIRKKGVDLLLDIIKKMPPERDFELRIFGDGTERKRLETRITQEELWDRVRVFGSISFDQMSTVYQQADIFIFPSLRESGGTVLVEAMANALPVVSLDMGISRLLKEKETGLFINTKTTKNSIINQFVSSICELLDDENLRYELGMNGYNFVNEELNWDNVINRVYGKLLKSNN